MKTDFFFDFETRSRVDLSDAGSVIYATHPSTEATLITWCFGRTGKVRAWRIGQPIPDELKEVAENPSKYNFVAHNITFDYLIWTLPFRKLIPTMINPKIEDITDNMALTCHYRVGAKLDTAAKVLGLPFTKDKEGRRIMLKQCKPNGKTNEFPELTEAEWDHFERYGIIDTELLRTIYYMCPALPASERFTWEWTFKRNLKGIRVDTALIEEMNSIYDEFMPIYTRKFSMITGGIKVGSNKAKEWFQRFWPNIPNMRKETVRDMLLDIPEGTPDFAIAALKIKAMAGSSSLAKIGKAKSIMYGGRIYELLAYHFAQTKRWAGRGVQVQNFPRPENNPKDPIPECNVTDLTSIVKQSRPNLVDPLSYCKNLLRRIWLPDEGKKFYCGDWSKIEPTVLFWLVGLGPIPKNWYEQMAGTIFGMEPCQVKKDSDERNLGKSAALGCGYGMGHVKFRKDTADKSGLLISEELSKRAVYAYRNKYVEIVQFWKMLEYAFKNALRGQATNLCDGKVTVMPMVRRANQKLPSIAVRIPSGGILYYHEVGYSATDGLTYISDDNGAPMRKKLYGGLLCEHVVSSTARELIVPSIYHLENAGFEILSLVHDEIWAQDVEGRDKEFTELMCRNPSWCEDMVITADGENGVRYLK